MMDAGWDTPCELTASAPRTGEQAILSRYLPLVKRAATHLRSQVSASFDQEDMEQVGMMGLLEAWRRYGGCLLYTSRGRRPVRRALSPPSARCSASP